MTRISGEGSSEQIAHAVDEFREQWIDGQRPGVDEFCARHPECGPELAGELSRFLFVAHGLEALTETSDGPDLKLGRELGDHRLIREIGRGGMGVVYEAEQISLHRSVALKVLPAHVTLRPSAVTRFRREASTAARLRHEGIVEVHAVGEQNGAHFFSMSFVEGAPLDAVIEELRVNRLDAVDGTRLRKIVSHHSHRPAEQIEEDDRIAEGGHPEVWEETYPRAVARIVRQVADALEYAHRAGVVHRDVKPSNILLQPNGTVILTDFGLAREAGLPTLTLTGQFAGTPHYVSPEQATPGGKVDARSDVYSLGATLYELLTLQRPFEEKSSPAVLNRILSHDEPAPPRRLRRSLPRDLETICLSAMEKDPERRYTSAGEMAADLRRFLDDRPVQARPIGPLERTARLIRRKPLRSAAAVAFLLLGMLFLFSEYRNLRELRQEKTEVLTQKQRLEKALEFMATGFGFGISRPYESLDFNAARMAPIARGKTLTAQLMVEQAIQSIVLVTERDSVDQAIICRTTGIVARLLGRYKDSELLLNEARRIFGKQEDPDPLGEIMCLHHLGLLEHDLMAQEKQSVEEIRSRFGNADGYYRSALDLVRAASHDAGEDLARELSGHEYAILHNHGSLLQDMCAHEYAQALASTRAGTTPLAVPLDSIEDYCRRAEALLQEALAGRQRMGESAREVQASTHHQLALLYYLRGRIINAFGEDRLEEARVEFESGREHIETALEMAPATLHPLFFERSLPHPDLRSRRLLRFALEDHLSPSPMPRLDGKTTAVRLLAAEVPGFYCVAYSPPETGPSGEEIPAGQTARIVYFDPHSPDQHQPLIELTSPLDKVDLSLAPTLSKGRLGYIARNEKSGFCDIVVLDVREAPATHRVTTIRSSHVTSPVWHPRGDLLYFSTRPPKHDRGSWVMQDKGRGIYWVDVRLASDQTPQPLFNLANQEFDCLSFLPEEPYDRVCFLHYPWHLGQSAQNLYGARLTPDGTAVEEVIGEASEIEEILIDNLADKWCAYAPDGQSIVVHQSFTADIFQGADRHAIVRLRYDDVEVKEEEEPLCVGGFLARPTFSRAGHVAAYGGTPSPPAIWVFDREWNPIAIVHGEDLGMDGWFLSDPVFGE